MESGVLAGYPVVDIKVTLVDGSFHEVDSSEMAFKIAGSMALKEAVAAAAVRSCWSRSWSSKWSRLRSIPATSLGNLSARRGHALKGWNCGTMVCRSIKAHVPLAEMFGYATGCDHDTGAGHLYDGI